MILSENSSTNKKILTIIISILAGIFFISVFVRCVQINCIWIGIIFLAFYLYFEYFMIYGLKNTFGESGRIFFGWKAWSVFFILVSIGISFMNFTAIKDNKFLWFHWLTQTDASIKPDMTSIVLSLILVGSVIFRNRLYKKLTVYRVIILTLDVLFFGSIINLFFRSDFTIPFINIDPKIFLYFALILCWFGIKGVASFTWMICLIIGAVNLFRNADAMEVYGIVYVLCGAVSLFIQMFYLSIETSPSDVKFNQKMKRFKKDLQYSITENNNYGIEQKQGLLKKAELKKTAIEIEKDL